MYMYMYIVILVYYLLFIKFIILDREYNFYFCFIVVISNLDVNFVL